MDENSKDTVCDLTKHKNDNHPATGGKKSVKELAIMQTIFSYQLTHSAALTRGQEWLSVSSLRLLVGLTLNKYTIKPTES